MTYSSSLIERLAQGEEKAYEALYAKHYSVLCLFANAYVKDATIAEAVVSDVVYTIWEKRDTLQITTSLRSYLMQAVKNRCYNWLKQQKRRDELATFYAEELASQEMDFNAQSHNPLVAIISEELDLKIEEALARLPEKTRQVFLLSRKQNLKYAEIAEQTQLSVDSVKYHMKSALAALRAYLSDYLVCMIIAISFFSEKS